MNRVTKIFVRIFVHANHLVTQRGEDVVKKKSHKFLFVRGIALRGELVMQQLDRVSKVLPQGTIRCLC